MKDLHNGSPRTNSLLRSARLKERVLVTLTVMATTAVGCIGPATTPVMQRQYLGDRGVSELAGLLAAQNDPVEFRAKLEKLTSSGDYESVYLLTHAMFELPWLAGKDARRPDPTMPKLLVERALDRLVAAQEHDSLSARYFLALRDDGDIEAAKAELLAWTKDHEGAMKWNGWRFLREGGSGDPGGRP